MRTRFTRWVCIILTLVLLISAFYQVSLAETPTDEELIEQYNIPNTWARPALLFAVRNGLLFGNKYGLQPTNKITRAEVAAILIRILGTTSAADLSRFSDIDPEAWYVESIGKAVSAGIISGSTDGTMRPTANITRQEAFSMIYRLIGVSGGMTEDLNDFIDGSSVSSWAKTSMMAMVRTGYVKGSAGYLNPKNNITRQEFVQVLYEIFTKVGKEIPSKFTGNFALAADDIPDKTTVSGDLLFSSEAEQIDLNKISVSGRLIIQGSGPLTLNLENCSIDNLVLCRPTVLTATGGKIERLTVFSPSTIYADCGSLENRSKTDFHGNAHSAALVAGSLTVASGKIDKKYTSDEYWQAQQIKRVRISGWTIQSATLYASHNGEGYHDPICTLPYGTPFTLVSHASVAYEIRLADGRVGYTKANTVSISSSKYYIDADYAKNVKECYVNYITDYTSNSGYIIWINRWTLKFNVFRGKKGQWDLVRSTCCVLGRNTMPTREGISSTYKKTPEFDTYDHYYHHLTWYWPNAIHSRLYYYNGSFYDSSMSKTVSDGCVRLYDEEAIWVYNTLPLGTPVIVY